MSGSSPSWAALPRYSLAIFQSSIATGVLVVIRALSAHITASCRSLSQRPHSRLRFLALRNPSAAPFRVNQAC